METEDDDLMTGCKLGLFFGATVLVLALLPASTGQAPPATTTASNSTPAPRAPLRSADFGTQTPTDDVRWLADRIAATGDNGNASFFLVDKPGAQLHLFDAQARWVASTPVLLGAAQGDHSVPGIGSRPMESIQLDERTTPAGRFVGERGRNTDGEDVVWVDYDAAVSMHRVRLSNPRERRAERLASATVADNRISYGCINVPVAFYERHVLTVFARQQANIYVLPDLQSAREMFEAPRAAPSHSGSLLLVDARGATN